MFKVMKKNLYRCNSARDPDDDEKYGVKRQKDGHTYELTDIQTFRQTEMLRKNVGSISVKAPEFLLMKIKKRCTEQTYS